jgi:hypothetical protein
MVWGGLFSYLENIMIKALKKFFALINRVLDGLYSFLDEAFNWSDELVEESKSARTELQNERKEELQKMMQAQEKSEGKV